jgi:alpha-beta hydrolase superfamily lysophospholipase
MAGNEPFVTYLELRESTPEGDAGAGLQHKSSGLVLLHVLELAAAGEPRGAITIVHDAGEHGGRYVALARKLAQEGYSLALPDLRGHGRSEGIRGHSNGIREVVRDIGDVQDHLAYRQPDAPKVLIGQGLGALWCLAYACERPDAVAGLVLAAPLLAPSFELPEPSGGLMKLFKKVGPTSPGRIARDPQMRESDADELVHSIITVRAGEEAQSAAKRYVPAMSTLAMPALVLAGANDPLVNAASVRALQAPDVAVEVFDGARHDVLGGPRSDAAAASIARWLGAQLKR